MELDLTRPRDLGDILGTCFQLYGRHFWLFAAIALAVVVPLDVITVGFMDGQLMEFDEDTIGGGPAYTLCYYLLATPLITAGHVSAVMQIGAGETPSVGRSLQRAGVKLLPVMLAIVLAGIGTLVGLLALIVPGIYLYIRWFLAAQTVVAEDLGPVDGLGYAWDLVAGSWWRVFGIVIVIGLISGAFSLALGIPTGVVGGILESGPLLVLAMIVVDTVVLSFTALAGTILFFDLKARRHPVPAFTPPPPSPLDRPESPLPG